MALVPPSIRASATLWQPLPDELELRDGEVQVVRVSLEFPESRLSEFARMLSPGERERAGRFYSSRDERRFVARRGLLRELLGRQLRVAPGNLVFSQGACGKPELAAPAGQRRVHFNAAHSNDVAVFALAFQGPLGVDVEVVRPMGDLPELVSSVFSERERSAWETVPAAERLAAFFEVWARKEAFLKGTGEGLQKEPNLVEVSLGDRPPDEALAVFEGGSKVRDWSVRSLSTPDCAIALALTRSPTHLSCWHWRPT
jgi:4'-phosphopantetheinyl transferase